MRSLVVARHAESELNGRNVLNGDPALPVGLTPRGEEQARALGAAAGPVDLAAHTRFERTRRTAELAWPGVPLLELPELDEIRFGDWEGTSYDEGYGAWARSAGPDAECPGGGESRAAAVRRYVLGYRALLDRPEETVAVVAHGAPVRYLLLAAGGGAPLARLEAVPLAEPSRLARDEVERAVAALERWLAAPAF